MRAARGGSTTAPDPARTYARRSRHGVAWRSGAHRSAVGAWSALLLALLVVAGSGLTSVAHAQEPAFTRDELGITITSGFGGVQPGRGTWSPIEISLTPTRLVAGTLTVRTNSSGSELFERRGVEVAAGTTKIYRFVVPPVDDLTVSFESPDREALTLRPRVGQPPAAFVVGLLGAEAPATAPPVVAYATGLSGTYAAIDPAWIELSPRGLDQVGTLVADLATLSELGEQARSNLVAAVANGLELVITATTDGPFDLAALGFPWNPAAGVATSQVQLSRPDGDQEAVSVTTTLAVITPSEDAWGMTVADVFPGSDEAVVTAAMTAGRGRIAVTGVTLGEGPLGSAGEVWQHVLQPGARQLDGLSDGGRQSGMLQQALSDSSLGLPSIPWLTAFLVGFVLLVGPVNGFVLRRRKRPELAWLTIPAITFVFAAGAFLGSSSSAPATGVGGTAQWWIDGVGTELSAAVVRAPQPGGHTLALPGPGWAVRNDAFGRPAIVDRSGGNVVVTVPLESLELGAIVGTRPTATPAPFVVQARTGPDGVTATVTNTTDLTWNDVHVRSGSKRVKVGDLAPGASQDVELTSTPGSMPTLQPWHEQFRTSRGPNGIPEAPRSIEELLVWEVLDDSPGLVWITATSTEARPGASLAFTDGSLASDIGGLVAIGVTPVNSGAEIVPYATSRTVVAESRFGNLYRPAPTSLEGNADAALRYRLPAPRSGQISTLVSTLNRGQLEGFNGGFNGGFPGGLPTQCFENKVTDEDGNSFGQSICLEGGVPQPFEGDGSNLPPCPPDATSCNYGPGSFEICRRDGSCEGGAVDVAGPAIIEGPRPPDVFFQDGNGNGQVQLEIYDRDADAWVLATTVFTDRIDGAEVDAAAYLSPLGEVFVRVRGEFHPFDFSGRGLGATVTGGAAA